MTLIPQRTVAAQVATQLETEIRRGDWQEWLPNERELCQRLQVSRSTLRVALDHLRRAGLTAAEHGIGHRIVATGLQPKHARKPSVALLSPESLEPLARLRPNVAVWIEDFVHQLDELGYRNRLYHGQHYYRTGTTRALENLVRRESHEVWILLLASAEMQRWFMDNRVPCIIAGSCHPGIDLPSVDLDYRALCRHAVGVLVRRGHRKIALLCRRGGNAGDLEGENAFREAAVPTNRDAVEAGIVWHDNTLDSVTTAVRRLFSQKAPPTGLLISNSNWYLTTVTTLARLGLRVPEDVSAISRNDDAFLDFIVPAPARYLNSPHVFAKRILTMALRVLELQPFRQRRVLLVPRFSAGASLGPPPEIR